MKYMLDTDTFSALVNGSPQALDAYAKNATDGIGISVITQGEIAFGRSKKQLGAAKAARIDYFLAQSSIVTLNDDVAEHYAAVRYALEHSGQPIGPNDTWIAAHALSLGATLVTNNLREFKRVKGLKVENWV
jgi:tRNA(fMet)-specific endonuclease VapC